MRCRDVPSDLADVDVVLRAADFDALATPVDAVAVDLQRNGVGSASQHENAAPYLHRSARCTGCPRSSVEERNMM